MYVIEEYVSFHLVYRSLLLQFVLCWVRFDHISMITLDTSTPGFLMPWFVLIENQVRSSRVTVCSDYIRCTEMVDYRVRRTPYWRGFFLETYMTPFFLKHILEELAVKHKILLHIDFVQKEDID